MMQSEVVQMFASGLSQREIARKTGLSTKKVLQILVTEGCVETQESIMFERGMSVDEIAETLGKKKKSVIGRIPYQKGMYNSDQPTENALRIRKSRLKNGGNNEHFSKWRNI